jgi:hypothetical protein
MRTSSCHHPWHFRQKNGGQVALLPILKEEGIKGWWNCPTPYRILKHQRVFSLHNVDTLFLSFVRQFQEKITVGLNSDSHCTSDWFGNQINYSVIAQITQIVRRLQMTQICLLTEVTQNCISYIKNQSFVIPAKAGIHDFNPISTNGFPI